MKPLTGPVRFVLILFPALSLLTLVACGDDDSSATPSASPSATLFPADASAPAAGACPSVTGDVVAITLMPDTPQPRCVRVTPPQKVTVKNDSGRDADVTLGGFTATVPAGQSHLFDLEVGAYLGPGVHTVHVSTYSGGSGPEVWLD